MGRKHWCCRDFSLRLPLSEAGGGPPLGARVLSSLALTHLRRLTSSLPGQVAGCLFHLLTLLSQRVQPACSLGGIRPRWEWRGGQRGWKALASSAPLLLLSIQQIYDRKKKQKKSGPGACSRLLVKEQPDFDFVSEWHWVLRMKHFNQTLRL